MTSALVAGRWLLALVLLGAGLAKVGHREEFASAIERYAIIPAEYATRLAVGLPWLEAAVGIVLMVGLVPAVSACCAAALLLGFVVAIGVNLARGRRFDCGCGALVSRQIGWPLLVRNAVLAAVAMAVGVGPTGLAVGGGTEHVGTRSLVPIPLIVIAIFGLVRCVQSYTAGQDPSRR